MAGLQTWLQTLRSETRPHLMCVGVQALLGYGDGDVFGMSCLSVCGPSSDKKVMRQMISLQRSGQPGGAKALCYKRDGTPFWSVLPSALHVCLSGCLSRSVLLCLAEWLAVCLSVCLFVCLSMYAWVYTSSSMTEMCLQC